jgi:fumarylacetoacetase
MTDCWIEGVDDSGYGLDHLPLGVGWFGTQPRAVTRVGDRVLPVGDVVDDQRFEQPVLNDFLAAGPTAWRETRGRIRDHLTDRRSARALPSVDEIVLGLPVRVGDYVDFYSSLHHATNLGKIFRPDGEALLPNWRHLPVAYHGRSGTIVPSGTRVLRPSGLIRREGEVEEGTTSAGRAPDDSPLPHRPWSLVRAPSAALDFELEVGFVVGRGNDAGDPIEPDAAAEHVFGVVLVNDWSARDIQSFEYQPLGPFLGKSFATTMSVWITPLDALADVFVDGPEQEPPPDARLATAKPWGLDVELGATLNGTRITTTNLRHAYWTFAQQLAHMTSNGAGSRPGDLFATGTISGPEPHERGSLIELAWNGSEPVRLDDGSERTWLEDGDTVALTASARSAAGERIELGPAVGTVRGGHR